MIECEFGKCWHNKDPYRQYCHDCKLWILKEESVAHVFKCHMGQDWSNFMLKQENKKW